MVSLKSYIMKCCWCDAAMVIINSTAKYISFNVFILISKTFKKETRQKICLMNKPCDDFGNKFGIKNLLTKDKSDSMVGFWIFLLQIILEGCFGQKDIANVNGMYVCKFELSLLLWSVIYVFGLSEFSMRGFENFPLCLAWFVVHFFVFSDICNWPEKGLYERVWIFLVDI